MNEKETIGDVHKTQRKNEKSKKERKEQKTAVKVKKTEFRPCPVFIKIPE
jgi:hypothetical protein